MRSTAAPTLDALAGWLLLLLCDDDPLDETAAAAGSADPVGAIEAAVPLADAEDAATPLPSGGTMPCILALCLLRKYLLQNSFWHRSQYASGLTMPPGRCCFIVATDGRRGAGVIVLLTVVTTGAVVVDDGDDHRGKKSISADGFIPGVVTIVDEDDVVAVVG